MKTKGLRIDLIIKVTLIFIIVITVIFVGVRESYKSIEKMQHPIKYTEIVEKYSAEYGVDKVLVYSVIKTESGFDPKAKSSENAVGLTQILPMTFDWLSFKIGDGAEFDDLYEPETSVKYGTWLLHYLIGKFGETETAVAAYHAGPGQVSEWLADKEYSDDGKTLKKIPFKDTNYYVEKVMNAYDIYSELLNEK